MSKLSGVGLPTRDGYYYLHTNGEVIYKPFIDLQQMDDFEQSPFVKRYWIADHKDRTNAWIIAVEAAAYGAAEGAIERLKKGWGLTDEDGEKFLQHVRVLHGKLDSGEWIVWDDHTGKNYTGESIFDCLVQIARRSINEIEGD